MNDSINCFKILNGEEFSGEDPLFLGFYDLAIKQQSENIMSYLESMQITDDDRFEMSFNMLNENEPVKPCEMSKFKVKIKDKSNIEKHNDKTEDIEMLNYK